MGQPLGFSRFMLVHAIVGTLGLLVPCPRECYPVPMGATAVFLTRTTAHGPQVRAYGDGRDSGWLDVCEEPVDDTDLALVAAAATEHDDIQAVIDDVIAGGGRARINDTPMDPACLGQAQAALCAAADLEGALPPAPPSPPAPRL